MIYWVSKEVLLNLLLHWIQLCLLLTLSKSIFFEIPVLIPLVLYLIRSVSAEVSPELDFSSDLERINIWFMALIPLALPNYQYDLLSFSRKLPKLCCSVNLDIFFWLWVNHFCLFCVHLMLIYHSVQRSHTWSDFSHSLRVVISETKILCHFILFFFIIDFDEADLMQWWYYFSYTYFWFEYLVGVTCSRLQELTLVVFFT